MDHPNPSMTRAELRARIRAVRGELHAQRERLTALIEACQSTTNTMAAATRDAGPRLFARNVLHLGGAEIAVRQQTVRHDSGSYRLTPTEWQLLTFLLAHPWEVHSRADLAAGAWGKGFAERASEVEVYVSRLRRKLGPAGVLLETVRGRGYRLLLDRSEEFSRAGEAATSNGDIELDALSAAQASA